MPTTHLLEINPNIIYRLQNEKDLQCTYKAILRGVRVTIVAVEKQ
jgi:hypothetical protein